MPPLSLLGWCFWCSKSILKSCFFAKAHFWQRDNLSKPLLPSSFPWISLWSFLFCRDNLYRPVRKNAAHKVKATRGSIGKQGIWLGKRLQKISNNSLIKLEGVRRLMSIFLDSTSHTYIYGDWSRTEILSTGSTERTPYWPPNRSIHLEDRCILSKVRKLGKVL